MHYDQIIFSEKIIKVVKEYAPTIKSQHDWQKDMFMKFINEYLIYLTMCRDNPNEIIRPSLVQDFVWHSHMMQHKSYIEDTTIIFGRCLKHDTSIPDSELDKLKTTNSNVNKQHSSGSSSSCGGMLTTLATIGLLYSDSMHNR